MSDKDDYRKGFEEIKEEIKEERDQSLMEQFVKGVVGLPKEAVKDLARSDAEDRGQRDAIEGNDYNPPNEEPSSGCFVSTACAHAAGLPDDCHELTVLRAFRDEVLLPSVEGRTLVAEYYRQAPELVARIRAHPDADGLLADGLARIRGAVALIEAREYAAATRAYVDAMRAMNAL